MKIGLIIAFLLAATFSAAGQDVKPSNPATVGQPMYGYSGSPTTYTSQPAIGGSSNYAQPTNLPEPLFCKDIVGEIAKTARHRLNITNPLGTASNAEIMMSNHLHVWALTGCFDNKALADAYMARGAN